MEDDVEKETIKLYDLKFERKSYFFENEEQNLENKEELTKNKNYTINDTKLQDLEKVFKQLKTKIHLNINFKQSFKKDIKFYQKFYLI